MSTTTSSTSDEPVNPYGFDEPQRVVLVHGHIFKNAGSSLDWSLQQNFGDDFLDDREDDRMKFEADGYLAEVLDRRPTLRAISSHHLLSTAQPPPNTHFVRMFLLRDPIERILSVYKFERKQDSDTPGSIAAKELSPRDYIKWRMADDAGATIRNYQTRYLGGMINASRRPVDDDVFATACATMRTAFVGLVENYDDSMVAFEVGCGLFDTTVDLTYERQNSNPDHVAATHEEKIAELRELIGPDLLNEVTRRNLYDAALYNLAAARLNSLVDTTDDMDERRQDFKDRMAARAANPIGTASGVEKLRSRAKAAIRRS